MKPYRIKKSDIDKKGRGLYATKEIKEGTKIINYMGKLITKKQTEESDKYDNSKPIYLFTVNKKNQWITNFHSQRRAHLIRSEYDAIISTSKGVMTERKARANGIGGEVLCIVA